MSCDVVRCDVMLLSVMTCNGIERTVLRYIIPHN